MALLLRTRVTASGEGGIQKIRPGLPKTISEKRFAGSATGHYVILENKGDKVVRKKKGRRGEGERRKYILTYRSEGAYVGGEGVGEHLSFNIN